MHPSTNTRPWYRQTAMMVVIGVLGSTLLSGIAMLTLAISNNDPLIISEQQYQQLSDEFKLTQARQQTLRREAALSNIGHQDAAVQQDLD